MSKVWFITGTSRGFGREWAEAALERGDSVAATARDVSTLDPLVATYGDRVMPIQLDVTDRAADFAAVAAAHERFGRLDIVVNNAGYGHFGPVEEASESDARDQLETNVFGALWVTQAALPFMREQGHGHIIQVSSMGGITAFPLLGIYHASKWALEGFSQSLAAEVAQFGIKVTLVEPAGYDTDWSGSSARWSTATPAYQHMHDAMAASREAASAPGFRGDPVATRDAILTVVDADEPPLRVLFGNRPLGIIVQDYEQRLATWRAWEPVSIAAHGTPAAG